MQRGKSDILPTPVEINESQDESKAGSRQQGVRHEFWN